MLTGREVRFVCVAGLLTRKKVTSLKRFLNRRQPREQRELEAIQPQFSVCSVSSWSTYVKSQPVRSCEVLLRPQTVGRSGEQIVNHPAVDIG